MNESEKSKFFTRCMSIFGNEVEDTSIKECWMSKLQLMGGETEIVKVKDPSGAIILKSIHKLKQDGQSEWQNNLVVELADKFFIFSFRMCIFLTSINVLWSTKGECLETSSKLDPLMFGIENFDQNVGMVSTKRLLPKGRLWLLVCYKSRMV